MDDDSDDCFIDDNGGLWVYVDEHYDEAEELAEHALPSPPPWSQDVTEDYDRYDIWEDLEYMTDGWYDTDAEKAGGSESGKGANAKRRKSPPRTRKRKAEDSEQQAARKRRGNKMVADEDAASKDMPDITPPVVWMSQHERLRGPKVVSVSTQKSRPVALLKDWRSKCPPEKFQNKPSSSPKVDDKDESSMHRKDESSMDSEATAEDPADPSTALEDEASGSGTQGDEVKLDLQSVAGMLSEEQLNAIRAQLREKGLDPSALEMVLQDMMEGNEREFGDEEADAEDKEDEEEEAEGDQ